MKNKPFIHNGKKYRYSDWLFGFELQEKVGNRYEHVAYVFNEDDAMDVLEGRPRKVIEQMK